MKKILMKGNEAIAEAAIRAGMTHYFGYPITPQTEISEYLAKHLPETGGTFIQAESEISAIYMVYGASAAGARAMTSSSSPGISLKQEGLSYLACAQLPCVIVNMMRGGPGLGGIQPSQADYFQAVKGGGHGDYHLIVLAPSSVQELADLTMLAFDLSDKYRNPAMILGDGMLGQMMEAVEFPETTPKKDELPKKDWAVGIRESRPPNLVVPFDLDPIRLEQMNLELQRKYKQIKENEARYEILLPEGWDIVRPDAKPDLALDLVLVGYGTVARVLKTVRKRAEKEGLRVALMRPITLWPFPEKILQELTGYAKDFLVVEMSAGQMVEDVRLSVNGKANVHFYGKMGGVIPRPQEILREVKRSLGLIPKEEPDEDDI